MYRFLGRLVEMGVPKLWEVVKPLCIACDFFTDAAGHRIAIDASAWLHAFAKAPARGGEAALDLLQARPTYARILRGFEDRLVCLLKAGIQPVFVFDGARPGAKASTDVSRSKERVLARERARQYLRGGDRVNAAKEAIKAASIPDELIYLVIHKILRPKGIGLHCFPSLSLVARAVSPEPRGCLLVLVYMVARGEADGQMAALVRWGVVVAVVTNDGDLIVHGVPRIYTKINYTSGACERYDSAGWTSFILPTIAESHALDSLDKARSPGVGDRKVAKAAAAAAVAAAAAAEQLHLAPLLGALMSEGVISADATKFIAACTRFLGLPH
jgi:hypothetical protein